MGNFNFTKNPFGLGGLNNINNKSYQQQSNYDVLGRKTVEEVQNEMKKIHGEEPKEEFEQKIDVEDLQQNFRNKMDNLRNTGRMQ